jgi:hypothetical protein
MNCSNGHINPPRYPPIQRQKTGRCKICHKLTQLKSRKKHYKKYLKAHNCATRKYWRNLRLKVLFHYCKGRIRCMQRGCSVTEPALLELDHINNDGKAHRKKVGNGSHMDRWIIKNNFPPIFKVFCANCHRANHKGVSWL